MYIAGFRKNGQVSSVYGAVKIATTYLICSNYPVRVCAAGSKAPPGKYIVYFPAMGIFPVYPPVCIQGKSLRVYTIAGIHY